MPTHTPDLISHAIQLAIAPVFLLTGIAALLGVIATRLARVIDRARALEKEWKAMDEQERRWAREEMHSLEKRRRICSWSINFCTVAALLICLVIASLFVEEFFSRNLRGVAGSFFVGAMAALIFGLVGFLREVYIATHSVSFDGSRLR